MSLVLYLVPDLFLRMRLHLRIHVDGITETVPATVPDITVEVRGLRIVECRLLYGGENGSEW